MNSLLPISSKRDGFVTDGLEKMLLRDITESLAAGCSLSSAIYALRILSFYSISFLRASIFNRWSLSCYRSVSFKLGIYYSL